ncbi:hypothetical protein L1D52_03045 [Vibrio brasiliensis]|uniref:hypothetical protein n=1 Tax=Vibrio brasiliensis TaxID=170652 RepID=UPI001EFDA8F1|nr:hypothetical protein [Vibrio brasiliensis]MCG9781318.1 hypothetical protein [Vibrio brasiliensis]
MNIPNHLLIPFSAEKLINAQVFWCAGDRQTLLSRYAYLIPDGETFNDLLLDSDSRKTFYAERYGGTGTALNGGGARVGLCDGYQVKGIGRTPVAGASAEQWYSYGGLTLIDAIHETINYHVVNALLPHGAVEIAGIILTGNNSALAETDTPDDLSTRFGSGALLVRKNVVRPAHFLPSEDYQPLTPLPYSELSRVKSLVRAYCSQFPSQEALIDWMSERVLRFAQQMTKARVCRLYHGAPSSSNFSIDAAWLDLTNTSFCHSGRNDGFPYRWLDDIDIDSLTFTPWFYFMCKYSGLDLNTEAFSQYYRDAVAYYQPIYLLWVLGIDLEEWPDESIETLARPLAADISELLYTPILSVETTHWDDQLASFIIALYTSPLHQGHAILMELLTALSLDPHTCLITSLRRCLITDVFDKKNVSALFRNQDMALECQQSYLQDYIACTSWAFANSDIMLEHHGAVVRVNTTTHTYRLSTEQYCRTFHSLNTLLSGLEEPHPVPPFIRTYLKVFDRYLGCLPC